MFGTTLKEKAYLGPFLVFIGLIAFGQLVAKIGEGYAYWALAQPQYWINPLQTLVCGILLIRFWREYQLERPRGVPFTLFIGVLVLAIWVAPQFLRFAVPGIESFELHLFGERVANWSNRTIRFLTAPRLEGFEPHFFGDGAAYWFNLLLRFVRLVIVVPLVEEIFWRGFLLRYVINPDFTKVPFGTFEWRSFAIVTVGFCLEHQMADWPAAILAGALYNLVAYRTRSLSSCVLAHAVTNLLLGFYVLRTQQWGFW